MLKARTISMMATPGDIDAHGALSSTLRVSARSAPHEGFEDGVPNPRKLTAASIRIATARLALAAMPCFVSNHTCTDDRWGPSHGVEDLQGLSNPVIPSALRPSLSFL